MDNVDNSDKCIHIFQFIKRFDSRLLYECQFCGHKDIRLIIPDYTRRRS